MMENKIDHIYRKIFAAIQDDVVCEIKLQGYKIDVGTTTFFHNHDGYELTLILDGEMKLLMDNQSFIFTRGDLLLIPPYVFHGAAMISDEIYKRIVITIRENTMLQYCTPNSDLTRCFFRKDNSPTNFLHLDEQSIQEYCELAFELNANLKSERFGADIIAASCIRRILVGVNRQAETHGTPRYHNEMTELVQQTFAYIDQHLTEEITLEAIAEYTHHNSTYINRKFKQTSGTTLQQYIIAQRITLAQKYLREGYSPCDACYMSGFNNYSHFSRTFTKQIGMSPRQYQTR